MGIRYCGTHSFRKRFAQRAYECSNDINLVRTLLQHADTSTTVRYLGISDSKIEKVLNKITLLFYTHWEEDEKQGNEELEYHENNKQDMVTMKCSVSKKLLDDISGLCRRKDLVLDDFIGEALQKYISEQNSST